VLDTLLADGRFSVDAVSGTSADALNWDCPGSMDG
jgi:predicted acylesterase/phospholipase RssA